MPATLDDVPDVTAFFQLLCHRFAIQANSWSLSVEAAVSLEVGPDTVRPRPTAQPTKADLRTWDVRCGGRSACGEGGVFAAMAMTPLDILLRVKASVSAAAAALAPALTTIPQLTSLDLHSNALRAAGATALAPALTMTTKLRSLNLGRNDLTAAGMIALAPALAAMPHMLFHHVNFDVV